MSMLTVLKESLATILMRTNIISFKQLIHTEEIKKCINFKYEELKRLTSLSLNAFSSVGKRILLILLLILSLREVPFR